MSRAHGTYAKSALFNINVRVGKSGSREPRSDGRRLQRYKRATPMAEALEPPVGNVKGQEIPAGLQHASNFCEGAILQLGGLQVMQHQDRDDRGKSLIGERKHRGITLHDTGALNNTRALNDVAVRLMLARKLARQMMVVFQAGHARSATPQLARVGARPRSHLENVAAEARVPQEPRKNLLLADAAPQPRRAGPIFQAIHPRSSLLAAILPSADGPVF